MWPISVKDHRQFFSAVVLFDKCTRVFTTAVNLKKFLKLYELVLVIKRLTMTEVIFSRRTQLVYPKHFPES